MFNEGPHMVIHTVFVCFFYTVFVFQSQHSNTVTLLQGTMLKDPAVCALYCNFGHTLPYVHLVSWSKCTYIMVCHKLQYL